MEKSTKQTFLFICQTNDDKIKVGTQLDIDQNIQWAEEANREIDFTVIAKIAQPVAANFPISAIVWYENKEREPAFVKKVELAILNYIPKLF